MTGNEQSTIPKPFQIKTVRGEPYQLHGRTLVPEVRIISWGKAQATVGARQLSGWARGFVWVVPLAMIEMTPEGERRIPTPNLTQKTVGTLLVAAVTLCLVFSVIRRMVRLGQCLKD